LSSDVVQTASEYLLVHSGADVFDGLRLAQLQIFLPVLVGGDVQPAAFARVRIGIPVQVRVRPSADQGEDGRLPVQAAFDRVRSRLAGIDGLELVLVPVDAELVLLPVGVVGCDRFGQGELTVHVDVDVFGVFQAGVVHAAQQVLQLARFGAGHRQQVRLAGVLHPDVAGATG